MKRLDQNTKRKKIWKSHIFILNSALVVVILFFFVLKWYKIQVTVDSTFGSKPDELIKLISVYFPNIPNKEIEVLN